MPIKFRLSYLEASGVDNQMLNIDLMQESLLENLREDMCWWVDDLMVAPQIHYNNFFSVALVTSELDGLSFPSLSLLIRCIVFSSSFSPCIYVYRKGENVCHN